MRKAIKRNFTFRVLNKLANKEIIALLGDGSDEYRLKKVCRNLGLDINIVEFIAICTKYKLDLQK